MVRKHEGTKCPRNIEVRGRQGNIYHLGTLAEESQRHREWPVEVFDLLRNRGSMPDTLLVMWKDCWECGAGASDRFFLATIRGKRLHVDGIPEWRPWDPSHLHWWPGGLTHAAAPHCRDFVASGRMCHPRVDRSGLDRTVTFGDPLELPGVVGHEQTHIATVVAHGIDVSDAGKVRPLSLCALSSRHRHPQRVTHPHHHDHHLIGRAGRCISIKALSA